MRSNDSAVAIFGGTFDPFTIAHRAICKQVMDEMPIDKLYVIPTIVDYYRPNKSRWLSDGERIWCIRHMLWSLGEEYIGRWEVDTHELDLRALCARTDMKLNRGVKDRLVDSIADPRRFLHSLLDFKARVGLDTKIDLILGTDSVKNFQTWYHWRSVAFNVDSLVIVQGREDDEVTSLSPKIVEAVQGRFCSMYLPSTMLHYVSASRVRSYYQERDLGLRNYLDAVAMYDSGAVVLDAIGWTEKKANKKGASHGLI